MANTIRISKLGLDQSFHQPLNSGLVYLRDDVTEAGEKLPDNINICMALNEICVAEGYGFFYYFPSQATFEQYPLKYSMVPNLAYTRYRWSEEQQQDWAKTSHIDRVYAARGEWADVDPLKPAVPIDFIHHEEETETVEWNSATNSSLMILLRGGMIYLARVEDYTKKAETVNEPDRVMRILQLEGDTASDRERREWLGSVRVGDLVQVVEKVKALADERDDGSDWILWRDLDQLLVGR